MKSIKHKLENDENCKYSERVEYVTIKVFLWILIDIENDFIINNDMECH